MVRSKLTDEDQKKLAQLYRDSDATTASLAEHFKVSVSTVTRVLRDNIPVREYQRLIVAKRAVTRAKESSTLSHLSLELDLEPTQEDSTDLESMLLDPDENEDRVDDDLESMLLDPDDALNWSRKGGENEDQVQDPRQNTVEPVSQGILSGLDLDDDLESMLLDPDDALHWISEKDGEKDGENEVEDPLEDPLEDSAESLFEETLSGLDDEDGDEPELGDKHSALDVEMLEDLQLDLRQQQPEEDLELDEEDEDEDEDDSEDMEFGEDILSPEELHVQVLPLEELEPPPICYVVIDRHQELTTCPLKDFISSPENLRDAGISPELANQARTLPVFYNHRVARRFSEMSRRSGSPPHKIIRFSGHLLAIVRHQLQNKGITHLLVDGQIYSLRIIEEI